MSGRMKLAALAFALVVGSTTAASAAIMDGTFTGIITWSGLDSGDFSSGTETNPVSLLGDTINAASVAV
ncbi:MAG: hypothetical protein WAN51_13275, partial [Alphaproteobacteria bacterium]